MADAETTRVAMDAAKGADENRVSSTSATTSIKGEHADTKKKEAHKGDSSSHHHTKESTRGRGDERRRRHSSSSSPASSRSRSRSRSATRSRKGRGSRRGGESSRSSRHHSSRHHRDSSSRRSRSRERHGRDRHSRRRHSRSRSRSNSRDRHREKSHRPSRRDSRDESGSSRRKNSDDRKRDGDRHRDHKPTSSHRKRSRDEKEDARGVDEKRLKEVKPDREKENGAMVKAIEKKNGQEEPAVAVKESSRDLQNENAPPQEEETSLGDDKQQENGRENSGSTSPVAENSSQSSAESKSNGVLVDPLAVASSARKLIEEAKATLLKGEDKAVPSTPAVDVNSIKMDILKALAEARSTIAEIKGSDTVASEKEKTEKSVESESSTEKVVHSQQEPSRRSQSQSPKKKIQSESASKVAAAVAAVDEFDMFSMAELDDSAMPTSPGVSALTVSEVNLQSNCDDAEGYYTTTVGEVLNGTYRVLGVVGKGVFSTVLRCARIAPSKGNELDAVAIKLIRNNEVMRDAAQTEVKLLKELSERDPRDKKHCVRLLDTFEHRNHVALVFEPMQMNVREAMKKFGGKGGISIQAVRIFSKHLLIALNHLEACAIVHADIKPDNILLDDKQTTIKLCDFGSAFKVDEGKQDPTPYLVSRFYRAPEIVLGLAYDRSVDMWSIGCCLFEMFTGKVMFPGSTNNEMLKLFMELKGKIPNKLIKKHRQAYIEQFQMEPHFTEDLKFCSRESDRVTGKPILRLMDNVKAKNDLGSSLLAAKSSTDDRKLVLELRSLLERMFTLDPTKRISVREALAHPFVKTS